MSFLELLKKAQNVGEINMWAEMFDKAGKPISYDREESIRRANTTWVPAEALKAFLENPKLLEKVAKLEHDRWSSFIEYCIHDGYAQGDPGYGTQVKEKWRKWDSLAQTPYDSLTEEMKERDRKFARLILKEVVGF